MVKGINRQVIVVKSPDPRLFEEAIFFVREGALAASGVTQEQVIQQARQAADSYLRKNASRSRPVHRLPGPLWGALGAGLASLGWAAGIFLL